MVFLSGVNNMSQKLDKKILLLILMVVGDNLPDSLKVIYGLNKLQ